MIFQVIGGIQLLKSATMKYRMLKPESQWQLQGICDSAAKHGSFSGIIKAVYACMHGNYMHGRRATMDAGG